MTRPLRWIFNFVLFLSPALCVATLALWVAARQVQRQFVHHQLKLENGMVVERHRLVRLGPRGATLVVEDDRHLNRHGTQDQFGRVIEPNPAPPPTPADLANTREQYEGLRGASPDPLVIAGGHAVYDDWSGEFFTHDFPEHDPGRYRTTRTRIRRATAPFPLLAAALALPALAAVATHLWRRARQRRRPPGLCRACGYNLTGNTSGKCSECGEPIDRPGRAGPTAPNPPTRA